MKIVHVSAVDATLTGFMEAQLVGLRDAGFEVHTACSPGEPLAVLRRKGIVCHEIPVSRSPNPAKLFRSVAALARLFRKERFSVVHAHTPIGSVSARLAASLVSVPHVFYTAHGFYFHDRMGPIQYHFHTSMERVLGRLTDHLFVQSREDMLTSVRLGIAKRDTVTYIGNGVDPVKFSYDVSGQERILLRERFGFDPKDFVFAYVGRLVKEKGFCELVDAVKIMSLGGRPIHLLVVGANLDGDRGTVGSEARRVISQLHLSDRFHFTGFTNNVRDYLAVADAFVLPSYREGLPRSIIEAMHMALPVVSTDIRGPREEVIHGVTGFLVPPRDSVALADAMDRLASSHQRSKDMGNSGRHRAMSDFCEQQVVDRVLDVYRRKL